MAVKSQFAAAAPAASCVRWAAASLLLTTVLAQDMTSWPVKCAKNCNGRNICEQVCSGVQKQMHACPAQEDCPLSDKCPEGTEPVDCAFGDWSAWSPPSVDCSGLCHRNRTISQANRCGGAPCEGTLTDSKACPVAAHCRAVQSQDCVLGEWGGWSQCGATVGCQRERRRDVLVQPANGGKLCGGLLEETEVCGADCNMPVHCSMSHWMSWSPCSKQCGGGQQTRLRTIITRAQNGGRTCMSPLSEKQGCNVGPCEKEETVDCKMGEWSAWTACITGDQKMRKRVIDVPPKGGGKACEAELAQTAGCGELAEKVPVDCKLGEWTQWQLCDRTCGGGQTFRNRELIGGTNGAECKGFEDHVETVETMECNTHQCNLDKESCRVSSWSAWSNCSTPCGVGQQTRQRHIVAEAQAGGLACALPLSDTRSCPGERPECEINDCEWAEWDDWSECSATCDGVGQRSRSKSILKEATIGGKGCSAGPISEAQPCGFEPCHPEVCVNGEFGDWDEWTQCTKSCRGGFRWHSRQVSIEANHCGNPPEGLATEAESCGEDIECTADVDCTLGIWSDWGDCDSKCKGLRKRARVLEVPATGEGKCGEGEEAFASLEQVEPCVGVADGTEKCGNAPTSQCEFLSWSSWGECSVSCGGGQRVRQRETSSVESKTLVIGDSEPQSFGRRLAEGDDSATSVDTSSLCEGATMATQPCNSNECDISMIDCEYGAWSDWGHCTKCDGQRMRHRGVITEAKNGGHACNPGATQETQACPRSCGPKLMYCVWGDWSHLGACSKTCGAGTKTRQRKMMLTAEAPSDPLAVATDDEDCAGELNEFVACEDNPDCAALCQPQDCVLSEWTEWSKPTCEGVCMRTRSIETPNNECGKPCAGVLNTTKSCPADCSSKDCVMSEWTGWSTCASEIDQKYQTREILQEPSFNGMACTGALNITSSCVTGPGAPKNCELSVWTDWSDCDVTCGDGQQNRIRGVITDAANGGFPCDGALQLMRSCNLGSCEDGTVDTVPQDCVYTAWSIWSRCNGDQDQQAYRTRFVQKPAKNGGKVCKGEVRETRGCGQESDQDVDCVFSLWSSWSACPVSCGGGQHTRSRSIEAHARGGGQRCQGALLEATACGELECPGVKLIEACEYSQWAEWGVCSATCGVGFKARARELTQPGVAGDLNCTAALEEVHACEEKPCNDASDCIWGSWKEWSDCVPSPDVCGIGYKKRGREIEQMPTNGGALCAPRVREQVMPVSRCRGQPECCVDAKWDDWMEWGECSASCGKGTKKRQRHLKVKETWCGNPAPGSNTEYAGCESPGCKGDLDCKFEEWSEWTVCSSNCHGNRTRHRDIKAHAHGNGKACSGSLEDIQRCNPGTGKPDPWSCEGDSSAPKGAQDCLMAEWSSWSECSATCKGGIQMRSRHIQIHPEKGGKSCETSMKETQPCNQYVQCFPGRVDCEWEEWTKWSECNNLDFKYRTRGMKTLSAGGGVACDGDVRQLEPCSANGTSGHAGSCVPQTYTCAWGKWSTWSGCSATCGTGGAQTRERKMQVSEMPIPDVQDLFDLSALETRLQKVEQHRTQDSVAAFVGGFSSLLAIALVVRGAKAVVSGRSIQRVPEYDVVPQHA